MTCCNKCLPVAGCGAACMASSVTVIMQRNMPGKSALSSNLELIGNSFGIIVSPIVIQFLVDQYGWRWAMRYHSIIGVNLAIIAWILRTPSSVSADKAKLSFCRKFASNMKGLRHLFTNGLFLTAILSNILHLHPLTTVSIHTVSRMVSLGYTAQTGSLLVSCYAGANLISR